MDRWGVERCGEKSSEIAESGRRTVERYNGEA